MKLLDLIKDLHQESKWEGFHKALFDHADPGAFHTVKTRQEYLNHKLLAEQILAEIKRELKPKGTLPMDGGGV